MKLAFVGGTGPAGIGLAERFAEAGHEVVVGSRSEERAREAAERVIGAVPRGAVRASTNAAAARDADVVFLCVPYTAQRATVEELREALAGKIVVSISNPIKVVSKHAVLEWPEAGSMAEEVQQLVPSARVVGALHEIRVDRFQDFEHEIHSDSIIVGDDEDAKKVVMRLVGEIPGVRAIDGGQLSNSRYVEGFVALLIDINFRYRAGVSFRITGLPPGAEPHPPKVAPAPPS